MKVGVRVQACWTVTRDEMRTRAVARALIKDHRQRLHDAAGLDGGFVGPRGSELDRLRSSIPTRQNSEIEGMVASGTGRTAREKYNGRR